MRLLRLLPERWQKFLHEAAKFGIVGGVNTVINYAVFNALALTVFVDGQLKAAVVATVVATFTSYLMNRHWTYRDRPKSATRPWNERRTHHATAWSVRSARRTKRPLTTRAPA